MSQSRNACACIMRFNIQFDDMNWSRGKLQECDDGFTATLKCHLVGYWFNFKVVESVVVFSISFSLPTAKQLRQVYVYF